MNYKVEQIERMLKAEKEQPECAKYGAVLNHWDPGVKPINLDEKALKCLLNHFKRRSNPVTGVIEG